jgi:hypothetical protein
MTTNTGSGLCLGSATSSSTMVACQAACMRLISWATVKQGHSLAAAGSCSKQGQILKLVSSNKLVQLSMINKKMSI